MAVVLITLFTCQILSFQKIFKRIASHRPKAYSNESVISGVSKGEFQVDKVAF